MSNYGNLLAVIAKLKQEEEDRDSSTKSLFNTIKPGEEFISPRTGEKHMRLALNSPTGGDAVNMKIYTLSRFYNNNLVVKV